MRRICASTSWGVATFSMGASYRVVHADAERSTWRTRRTIRSGMKRRAHLVGPPTETVRVAAEVGDHGVYARGRGSGSGSATLAASGADGRQRGVSPAS